MWDQPPRKYTDGRGDVRVGVLMVRRVFILSGLALCLALPQHARAANLLVNGGFESPVQVAKFCNLQYPRWRPNDYRLDDRAGQCRSHDYANYGAGPTVSSRRVQDIDMIGDCGNRCGALRTVANIRDNPGPGVPVDVRLFAQQRNRFGQRLCRFGDGRRRKCSGQHHLLRGGIASLRRRPLFSHPDGNSLATFSRLAT